MATANEVIRTYEGAKAAFQKGLAAFNKAMSFYVLDGYVTEHIDILQDIGSLYLYLIAFEKNPSIQW